MAFFRFSRDKRGYEHFYLVEPVANRRGKARPRVLYWFRTPPNVKIGREPFDDAVRRALEAQNPSVVFDWRKILEAPIPSADADKWRERRRVERAARQATRGGASTDDEERAALDEPSGEPTERNPDIEPAPTVVEAAAMTVAPVGGDRLSLADRARRKRRRRRRGRDQPPAASSPSAAAENERPQASNDETPQQAPDDVIEPPGE